MTLPSIEAPDGAPRIEDLESQLPSYEDFRCIGVGAMGVVYEARHVPLDRSVAVKVLSPAFLGHGMTTQRFFREARAMAKISHPNIVPVFEVGGEGTLPYFTMELIPGGSLKEMLAEHKQLAPRRAAEIARDIGQALQHAHQAGILHRDIKPGNVLMDQEGVARLADFGLVRHNDGGTLTATDAIVGTPQYMSPEQVRSEPLDGRSDQFALGVTLYEMLAGRPPFEGDSPVSVLRSICDAEPVSLRKLRSELPGSLEAIVMRMLEKDPGRRYPDLAAANLDLERYLRGEAVEASLPGRITRSWRRLRSNRLAWRYAIATGCLAILAGAYWFNTERLRLQQTSNQTISDAATALRGGDADRAEELLQTLTQRQRNDPALLLLQAQVSQRRGDVPAALAACEQAYALAPDDPAVSLFAVRTALDDEDFRSARQWMKRVRQLPADADTDPAAIALLEIQIPRRYAESAIETWEDQGATPEVERYRALAVLQLASARDALEAYRARFGETFPSRKEDAFIHALEALITRNPTLRIERMKVTFDLVKTVLPVDVLGIGAAGFDPEALALGQRVMQEVQTLSQQQSEEEGESDAELVEMATEAGNLLQRYTDLANMFSLALSAAKEEVRRSSEAIDTPAGARVSGPLGQARDFVTGMVSGLFGGGEE